MIEESIAEYLAVYRPSVTRNINTYYEQKKLFNFLETIVDAFDPPATKNLETWIDNVIDDYSLSRKEGDDDFKAVFKSHYATTMQLLANHYLRENNAFD